MIPGRGSARDPYRQRPPAGLEPVSRRSAGMTLTLKSWGFDIETPNL